MGYSKSGCNFCETFLTVLAGCAYSHFYQDCVTRRTKRQPSSTHRTLCNVKVLHEKVQSGGGGCRDTIWSKRNLKTSPQSLPLPHQWDIWWAFWAKIRDYDHFLFRLSQRFDLHHNKVAYFWNSNILVWRKRLECNWKTNLKVQISKQCWLN